MKLTCLKCGGRDFVKKLTVLESEVRNEIFSVETNAHVCQKCNNSTLDLKKMGDFQRNSADLYRKKHNLLTSDQIVSLRNSLGMSQIKFAEHTHISVASIKRWELGAIQDEANNYLMKITSSPDASMRASNLLREITGGYKTIKNNGTISITATNKEGTTSADSTSSSQNFLLTLQVK